MSCELTIGYSKPACKSVAGISSLVVIATSDLTLTIVDNAVTVVDKTAQAFRLSLDINSGFANQTPTGSRENNSIVFVQEVMAMLKDDELTTEQLVSVLSSANLTVVAEYRNGKNKVFGLVNGMSLTTATMVSGQNGGDLNGNTLTFSGEEDSIAPHISNALVAQMLVFPS